MVRVRNRQGSKLNQLTGEQQEAVYRQCRKLTIVKGLEWLKAEMGVEVKKSTLGNWLRKKRLEISEGRAPRKVRADSRLGMLEERVQEAVFAHCEKMSLEDGAAWLAREHGVTIAPQGLGKWLQKRRGDIAFEERLDVIRDDRDRARLVGELIGTTADLTKANSVMIAQAVFEEFRKKAEERDDKRLAQYINLALRTRCVDLAYGKFQVEAQRRARQCLAELKALDESDEDETEKSEKAMMLLFGPEPREFLEGDGAIGEGGTIEV